MLRSISAQAAFLLASAARRGQHAWASTLATARSLPLSVVLLARAVAESILYLVKKVFKMQPNIPGASYTRFRLRSWTFAGLAAVRWDTTATTMNVWLLRRYLLEPSTRRHQPALLLKAPQPRARLRPQRQRTVTRPTVSGKLHPTLASTGNLSQLDLYQESRLASLLRRCSRCCACERDIRSPRRTARSIVTPSQI